MTNAIQKLAEEVIGGYCFADLVEQMFPNVKRHRRIAYKLQVVEAYGGKCACCGEKQWEFLTIDHIDGDGKKHREEIGTNIYRWLIIQGFPQDGFRLLCLNCHMARGYYGYCPHVRIGGSKYQLQKMQEVVLP